MTSTIRKLAVCSLAIFAVGCANCQQCDVVCEDPGVPMMHPLGVVSQAHYNAMQANGEAADFVMHSGEFEEGSSELNAAGRDHILEIGARMGGTPFPVIVERGESVELDVLRRDLVTRVLSDLGNSDAGQRTMISRAYSDGMSGVEAVGHQKQLR